MADDSKPIVISTHAAERMQERGVTEGQLVNTIRHPQYHRSGTAPFTDRLEREFHPQRLLIVIIDERDDSIHVVTTFWKRLGRP